MNDHYYTADPVSVHDEKSVCLKLFERELTFITDAGVFSRDGLDKGTRVLLDALPPLRGRVLDLGCGWGPVGVSLALTYPETQIVMTDVNRRAAELAARNAEMNGAANITAVQGDGFENVDGTFDFIITNPPIRAGKQVIYALFAEARQRLVRGGQLYIVIRKQQGAPSAQKYLQELFGNCAQVSRESGYHVLVCTFDGQNG